jgi:glucose uptake protein GlcU
MKKKKKRICFVLFKPNCFFRWNFFPALLVKKKGWTPTKLANGVGLQSCVFCFFFFVTFEPFSTMKPFLLLCLFVTAALAQGSNGGYPGE